MMTPTHMRKPVALLIRHPYERLDLRRDWSVVVMVTAERSGGEKIIKKKQGEERYRGINYLFFYNKYFFNRNSDN